MLREKVAASPLLQRVARFLLGTVKGSIHAIYWVNVLNMREDEFKHKGIIWQKKSQDRKISRIILQNLLYFLETSITVGNTQ